MATRFDVWNHFNLRAELSCFFGNDGTNAIHPRFIV